MSPSRDTASIGILGPENRATPTASQELSAQKTPNLGISQWSRARLAAAQARADRTAREVLAAFADGRSAELDPRASRDTLTSQAIAAGWGGR